MALQKDKQLSQLKIAEVADHLINFNGYYGLVLLRQQLWLWKHYLQFFSKNENYTVLKTFNKNKRSRDQNE
jgi:hypothetical protein